MTDEKKRRKKIHVFDVINSAILILFGLCCLYPFVNQVMISFSSQADFYNATLFVLPKNFNLDSYIYIIYQDNIGTSFLISIFVAVAGTAYSMCMTVLGAYVLTKKDVPGRKLFFVFVLITMFFGGGLIPFYIVVQRLGLTNNLAGLIIPFAVNTFNMIILRNFFKQVPDRLIESCKIDGANEFVILFRFVLPLSKAGLATISLFYLVDKWNDWYWPMIFMDSADKVPLALALRNVLSANQSASVGNGSGIDPGTLFEEGKQSAMIVIAMIPILAVYPFVQKYFVKGVMIGSVKA
ncbi:MAG: carbohydrate ABC transporter permease [Christensenellales bacterium]